MIYIQLSSENGKYLDYHKETIVQNSFRKNELFIIPYLSTDNTICTLTFQLSDGTKVKDLIATIDTKEYTDGTTAKGYYYKFSNRAITSQAGTLLVSAKIYKVTGTIDSDKIDEEDESQVTEIATITNFELTVQESVTETTTESDITQAEALAMKESISQNATNIANNKAELEEEIAANKTEQEEINKTFVDLESIQEITGTKSFANVVFNGNIRYTGSNVITLEHDLTYSFLRFINTSNNYSIDLAMPSDANLRYTIYLPSQKGTLALVSDVESEKEAREEHDVEQDNRITSAETLISNLNTSTSAMQIEVTEHLNSSKSKLVNDFTYEYNGTTGHLVLTLTMSDESTKTLDIDLPTENSISSAEMNGYNLVLNFVGGASATIDMSKLISDTLHKDSDTIQFTTNDNHEITANVKEKSLDEKYFTDEFNADLTTMKQAVANETERIANENTRIANETTRGTNEAARQELYEEVKEKFEGFEGVVKLTESEYSALETKDKFYFVIVDDD